MNLIVSNPTLQVNVMTFHCQLPILVISEKTHQASLYDFFKCGFGKDAMKTAIFDS